MFPFFLKWDHIISQLKPVLTKYPEAKFQQSKTETSQIIDTKYSKVLNFHGSLDLVHRFAAAA